MFIKKLRRKHHLSQEMLAERSGLSLRTVQRLESGHRVSYASLRALSAAFNVDVDTLEQELYALNQATDEYKETPLLLRLFLASGWFSSERQRYVKIEAISIISVFIVLLVWLSSMYSSLLLFEPGIQTLLSWGLLTIGSTAFLGAYFSSITIRIGDKYGVWAAQSSFKPFSYLKFLFIFAVGSVAILNAFYYNPNVDKQITSAKPWEFLGKSFDDADLRQYLRQTRDNANKQAYVGQKIIEQNGCVMNANKDDVIVRVACLVNLVSMPGGVDRTQPYLGTLPLSLTIDMERKDVDSLLGEPLEAIDTVAFYLVEGKKLNIDLESVEFIVHFRRDKERNLLPGIRNIVFLQPDPHSMVGELANSK